MNSGRLLHESHDPNTIHGLLFSLKKVDTLLSGRSCLTRIVEMSKWFNQVTRHAPCRFERNDAASGFNISKNPADFLKKAHS
jgi:hypothetical protein